MPPGTTPLWGPGAVPSEWGDVCGVLKPPDFDRKWKMRLHGAFSIPHDSLGLRSKDQSCHHQVWLHLALVGHRGDCTPREKHDQRLLSRKDLLRTNPTRKEANSRRRQRPFAFVIAVHTSNTRSHEHKWKSAPDRGTPRPLFNDLMRPRHLGVRLSPFRESVSILSIISCLMSNKEVTERVTSFG